MRQAIIYYLLSVRTFILSHLYQHIVIFTIFIVHCVSLSRWGLSGSSPCRWYINEDLPEINGLRAQLQDRVPIVRGIMLPGQTGAEISVQVDL